MTDVSKSNSAIMRFLIYVVVLRKMFLSIGCQMKMCLSPNLANQLDNTNYYGHVDTCLFQMDNADNVEVGDLTAENDGNKKQTSRI